MSLYWTKYRNVSIEMKWKPFLLVRMASSVHFIISDKPWDLWYLGIMFAFDLKEYFTSNNNIFWADKRIWKKYIEKYTGSNGVWAYKGMLAIGVDYNYPSSLLWSHLKLHQLYWHFGLVTQNLSRPVSVFLTTFFLPSAMIVFKCGLATTVEAKAMWSQTLRPFSNGEKINSSSIKPQRCEVCLLHLSTNLPSYILKIT